MHYRRIAPSWIASLDAGGLHSESLWKLLDIPHILRTLKMRSYEASHFELYLSALLTRCKSEISLQVWFNWTNILVDRTRTGHRALQAKKCPPSCHTSRPI